MSNADDNVLIYIVSARYGLIKGSQPIPFYDQRITAHQVLDHQSQIYMRLELLFKRHSIGNAFISVGKNYGTVLNSLNSLLPPNTQLVVADGPPGRRAAMLHEWLYLERSPSVTHLKSAPLSAVAVRFRLRGKEYSIQSRSIKPLLRKRLKCARYDSTHFHSWFVSFDGKTLAPKWIVSQLTGLPVSAFNTDDARRVLHELGFCVERQQLIEKKKNNFRKV